MDVGFMVVFSTLCGTVLQLKAVSNNALVLTLLALVSAQVRVLRVTLARAVLDDAKHCWVLKDGTSQGVGFGEWIKYQQQWVR